MSNTKTPNYIGPGEHSVRELEKMCSQFQQIISEMNASQFVNKDDLKYESGMEKIINEYFSSRTPEQIKADYEKFEAQDRINFPQDYEDKHEAVSSDVEQALANISHYVAGENVDPKFKGLTISVVEYNEAISAIRKCQSTQRQTVNSDVEQFFKYFPNHGDESGRNEWTVVYGEDDDEVIITAEDTEEDAQEVCRRLNKILFEQSTQQPATINFFSDEEIRKMFGDGKDKEAGLFCEAMVAACHTIQSKLKERVNCVDEDKTKCSNEGCQLPASCGGKCGAHCDCLA